MTDVNERALDYYEEQGDLSDLPAESLERRARVIGAIGIDEEDLGNKELARKKIQEWHRTTRALLEEIRTAPIVSWHTLTAENRLALLLHSHGKKAEALTGFRRSAKLLQRISLWGADRPRWLKLSALVAGNICASEVRKKR